MCPPNQHRSDGDAVRQAERRADLAEFARLNTLFRGLRVILENYKKEMLLLRGKLLTLEEEFNYLQAYPCRRRDARLRHNFREICRVHHKIDDFFKERQETITALDCVHEHLQSVARRLNTLDHV